MNSLDKNIRRPYSVIDYDPSWSEKFEAIRQQIAPIFGSKAIRIEHVGSTSVPGMKAKPLIDVLVNVASINDLQAERTAMESLGYKSGSNYIEPDSLIFYKEDEEGRKSENVHVCIENSGKSWQFLKKRDYLRRHPEKAREYSELKEKMNKLHPDDYPAYRAGKDAFLEDLGRLVREEENK